MQPIINKQTEEELITHIKDSLMAHEETYVAGAWEKFAEKEEKKRTPIFWLNSLSGIAAILAIGFTGFLLTNKDIDPVKTDRHVKINRSKPLLVPNKHEIEDYLDKSNTVFKNESLDQKQIKRTKKTMLTQDTISDQLVSNSNGALVLGKKVAIETVVERPENEITLNVPLVKKKIDILEFLANETTKNETDSQNIVVAKKESKWGLGLVVAPSYGNSKKLDMGYGISMNYRLSAKFSLGSGIAYNQMSAKESPNPSAIANSPAKSSIASVSTKSLQSVEQSIAGIDIPLELKYNLIKNIYANVGVSAFAVINQKISNTYIEEKVIQQTVNVASGTTQIVNVLVLERVTEKETPTKVANYSYLGFYNLSFGYKKKIFKNSAFAIEPFIKLPMKEVTQENLKLIGTGLRLKFDF